MVITPNFRLDTDIFIDTIKTITVVDNIKDESDSCEIVCLNTDANIFKDTILDLYLGQNTEEWFAGKFKLQAIEITAEFVKLIFTSVSFSKDLIYRRDTSYKDTSLKKIIEKIAKKHNLMVKCNIDYNIAHIDQSNESDISLLNRLADKYNAVFNIKNNTLIFLKKDKNLPKIDIDLDKAEQFIIRESKKFMYKSVEVKYRDFNKNEDVRLNLGEEPPTLVVADLHNNKEEALSVAKAQLQKERAKSVKIHATVLGQNLFAGAIFNYNGYYYIIKQVTHTIDSVYRCQFEAEILIDL